MKIVIGISGASGAIYSKILLEKLALMKDQYDEAGVIFSDNAKSIWQDETGLKDLRDYPFKVYEKKDFRAPFASGSGGYSTMIIAPCSMGTLGRIANGISDDLMTRAADVILKEGRKLILVPRETPLNLIHIENMKKIMLAGGIICPANPSFYSKPKTIEEVCMTVVNRILEIAGFETGSYRWGSKS